MHGSLNLQNLNDKHILCFGVDERKKLNCMERVEFVKDGQENSIRVELHTWNNNNNNIILMVKRV